ncbi:uncharacterized protein LOC143854286 [Tasmannia lanceolata]|uniref:uncharacterized protein LOC143854286 n=1 Tax=Tasmannia lanceolata TaxID=3420 RepID=UPI004063E288
MEMSCTDQVRPLIEWKGNSDGSIPCPPMEMGGCGNSLLELKFIFPEMWVSLLGRATEEIAASKFSRMSESEIAKAFPVYCGNSKGQHCGYLIDLLIPFLKQMHHDQKTEKAILRLRFKDCCHLKWNFNRQFV